MSASIMELAATKLKVIESLMDVQVLELDMLDTAEGRRAAESLNEIRLDVEELRTKWECT